MLAICSGIKELTGSWIKAVSSKRALRYQTRPNAALQTSQQPSQSSGGRDHDCRTHKLIATQIVSTHNMHEKQYVCRSLCMDLVTVSTMHVSTGVDMK